MRASIMMRLRGDERGVYAILFAIIIIVLFTMVAIAIDLSSARAEVRTNQSRADFAALAAGKLLAEGDPVGACAAAWNYIVLNTTGLPTGAGSPCNNPNIPTTCNLVLPWVGTSTNSAPYTIKFQWPVPDGDAFLEGRVGGDDGEPCERFGVSITTAQDVLFGGVVGSAGINAPANSVVRGYDEIETEEPIALLLLDPVGCIAVEVGGGGTSTSPGGVQVFPSGATTGKISVDSDGSGGSCGSNRFSVDVTGGGDQPGRIYSCGTGSDPTQSPPTCTDGGTIEIYNFGGGNCVQPHCDADDIPDQLKPLPQALTERRTRAPVDSRLNCQTRPPGAQFYTTKAGLDDSWPASLVPLAECDDPKDVGGMLDGDNDNHTTDYVDELRAFVGGSGCPVPVSSLTPSICDQTTWKQYPADLPGNAGCTLTGSTAVTLPLGNWWINCPSGLVISSGASFTVRGGNVVLQNGLLVRGNFFINTGTVGTRDLPTYCTWIDGERPDGICPNDSESSDYSVSSRSGTRGATYLYLRNGNFEKRGSGGTVRMFGVFTYINNGHIDFAGGSAELTWIAPYHGTFEDMALWSESSDNHKLAGSSSQNIEGAFFTPYANPFEWAGSGAQDQAKAQFLSYQVYAHGNGLLKMSPDPERIILFPRPTTVLIR